VKSTSGRRRNVNSRTRGIVNGRLIVNYAEGEDEKSLSRVDYLN
jgi:hypothetical protein